MKPERNRPDWIAIEKAAIAGVPYPELATRFRVTLSAIKKQASRNRWPVPARIRRRAKELSPAVTGPEAVTAAAESLLRDGEAATGLAMRVIVGKLQKAAAKPQSVADIASVTDVVSALKGARLAAGMDRGQPMVQIALFGARLRGFGSLAGGSVEA